MSQQLLLEPDHEGAAQARLRGGGEPLDQTAEDPLDVRGLAAILQPKQGGRHMRRPASAVSARR
jgi:hypothetical protein